MRRTILALGIATGCALAAATPAGAADAGRDQWYIGQFNMTSVWQTTKGAGVTVAIVGTGADAAQTDVSQNLRGGVDFTKGYELSSKTDSSPAYAGTQMAALIVGSGAAPSGVKGLAPAATVLPITVLGPGAKDVNTYYESLAIRYAVDHGARVVLTDVPLPYASQAVSDAVRYAVSKNVIVVAPAGNNGKAGDQVTLPCSITGVVCVSGVSKNGALWPSSSSGAAIDLGAPADTLPVPTKTGFAELSSTHYAAALTAGEAALVWSAHSSWTAGQVIRAMIHSTSGGSSAHIRVNDQIGYGIISPSAAVNAAAPSEKTNPFLPIAPATAAPTTKAPSTTNAATHASAGGGKGTSAVPWIAAGGSAVVMIGIVGLVWWLIRRRSRGEGFNYAYGASYYDRPSPSQTGSYPTARYPQADPRQSSQSGSWPVQAQPEPSSQPQPAVPPTEPRQQQPATQPSTQPAAALPPSRPQPLAEAQTQPAAPAPSGYTAAYVGAPDPENPDWRNVVDTTQVPEMSVWDTEDSDESDS